MKNKNKTIRIKWLHDKFANFVKGKIYVAEARFVMGKGDNKTYTDFKIVDEDGDYYGLDERRLGKDFIVLGE